MLMKLFKIWCAYNVFHRDDNKIITNLEMTFCLIIFDCKLTLIGNNVSLVSPKKNIEGASAFKTITSEKLALKM